jgi:hypothetical protein
VNSTRRSVRFVTYTPAFQAACCTMAEMLASVYDCDAGDKFVGGLDATVLVQPGAYRVRVGCLKFAKGVLRGARNLTHCLQLFCSKNRETRHAAAPS